MITDVRKVQALGDADVKLQVKAWKVYATKKRALDGLDFRCAVKGANRKEHRLARLTAIVLKLGQVAHNALVAVGHGQNVAGDIEAQQTDTASGGGSDTDEEAEEGSEE